MNNYTLTQRDDTVYLRTFYGPASHEPVTEGLEWIIGKASTLAHLINPEHHVVGPAQYRAAYVSDKWSRVIAELPVKSDTQGERITVPIPKPRNGKGYTWGWEWGQWRKVYR